MARTIETLPIETVSLDPDNARKHSDLDVDAIARSLDKFGQQTPIVVDADRIVVKGNGTLLAAIKLGWTEIDAIQTVLTGDQLRAYAIADNQTALLSEWDIEKLEQQVQAFEADLQMALGFPQQELDALLAADIADPDDPGGEPEEPDAKDDYSIRIDQVSPEHRDVICQMIDDLLEKGGYAYRAAAY